MKKERITFQSLGHALVGVIEYQRELPTTGIILFHGLTNSKDDCPLIKEAAKELAEAGFATFRFDFFGSGESPGVLKDRTWSISEQNAKDAIKYFQDRGVTRIGLWGRSTGGTVAILCGDNPNIEAFVLATTPVLLQDVFITRFEKVRKLEIELEERGKRLPGTGEYKGEFRFSNRFFEEVPNAEKGIMANFAGMSRVLVLATTPDTKVPLNNSTTIINRVREPKEIHIFEGADHDYRGVENEAIRLIVSWFKEYVG